MENGYLNLWNSLSITEQEEIEKKALESTDPFSRKNYEDGKERGGTLFKAIQKWLLVEQYNIRKMENRENISANE